MDRSSDFKFWDENGPDDSCVTAYSPRLWEKTTNSSSPLLPYKQQISPTSRLRAIVHGKNELTEMIRIMPESSYDLSLKDIVDNQKNIEEKENKVKHKIQQKNKKSTDVKYSKICRSESMETKVFLLKMFLPVSLCSDKKIKPRKASSDGSEKRASKDWWKTISLAVKDKRSTRNVNRSTSDIRTSIGKNTWIPCQESLSNRKGISRGCLF